MESAIKRPIILGLVGDSAAGKSTVTRGLMAILGEDRVSHVCTDDYHKYDRLERIERGITALHPDCNHMDILELHLERLHYGQPILKPVYDHSNGTLVRPRYVRPREFVIVEGLLGFSTPVLEQFYDVKVFLDPPEPLRRLWKVKRDTSRRGYTEEQVYAELERREADTRQFIRPQRTCADIVVSFCPLDEARPDQSGPNLNVKLVLRPTIPHPDLTYLIEENATGTPAIRLSLARDAGRPVDLLEIDGNVSAHYAAQFEAAVWAHLSDLLPVRKQEFGLYADPIEVRHSHPLALTQLLLTYHLLRNYSYASSLPLASPVAALSRTRRVPVGATP
jgi:phosphoribulokinase